MNPKKLEQFIEGQGWSTHGVVSLEEIRKNLKKHEAVFDDWMKRGFSADLDYLERMKEDRFHPENKLADIKSVIVLGAIYSNCGSAPSSRGSNSGVVSRYARGKDYHKVLKKRLIELSDWLKSEIRNVKSEIETYVSVDSGPTVDRVLAETAGLGFFGKNSCLIDPSKGSFFFIASLYTNLELRPTEKRHFPNCGDCQKCQMACPTGAIVKPGQIDARKCISYLTIENKEGIPVELRSKIGNRLFGCDICQEVCPFNVGRAHHQTVTIKVLSPESGVGSSLDLKELLSIKTDEEFLEKFAGTPLMRAKRRGLLRNACVVAGNSGDVSLTPLLQDFVDRESDDMLVDHARWAIDQLSLNCS